MSTLIQVPIPKLLADGRPDENFPSDWAIYSWLKGNIITREHAIDSFSMASDLANFILSLQNIDAGDGLLPGNHNFYRGVPIRNRDHSVQKCLQSLAKRIDVKRAREIWDMAIKAPTWSNRLVWIHGDLDERNILIDEKGKLCGVLDFGGLGVGDPACDIMVAFKIFDCSSRQIFREKLKVDDATWARAKGWVLSQALSALDYYTLENNESLVRASERWLKEVLEDEA